MHRFSAPTSLALMADYGITGKKLNHLRCLRRAQIQPGAEAISKGRHFRAAEIDLAIEAHEQLNRFHLSVVRGKAPARADKLVRKVLDGVPENLQRMACLWRDFAATHHGAARYRRRCRRADREPTRDRSRCHPSYPHLNDRRNVMCQIDHQSAIPIGYTLLYAPSKMESLVTELTSNLSAFTSNARFSD